MPGALCPALVAHIPDAGIAYQPGIDASGNTVAPADLPKSDSAAGNFGDVVIALTLNLKRQFKIPDAAQLFNFRAELGTLAVSGNQVYFNGKALAAGEADLLAAACREEGFDTKAKPDH